MIGPVYAGEIPPRALEYWDGLADALESGGVDGFVAYVDSSRRSTRTGATRSLRFTRERMLLHRHPEALVDGAARGPPLAAVSRRSPSSSALEVPALVVASHDGADPGHPRAVAEAYAEHLPQARLIGEEEGESPLAWQGGRLSREIADFCAETVDLGF